MTKQTEAMKLALEALERQTKMIERMPIARYENGSSVFAVPESAWIGLRSCVFDLRQAIEQATQKRPQNCGTGFCSCIECVMEPAQPQQEPLFKPLIDNHPGLAEELKAMDTAQPPQEPVTGMTFDAAWASLNWEEWRMRPVKELFEELHRLTSPPAQRKPLTHEQRVDLLTKFEPLKHEWHAPAILIDMVEAAHGITGEQK